MKRTLVFLISFLLASFLYSDAERKPVPLKRGSGAEVLYFDFGETAPKSFFQSEKLQEPKLEDLKLGFLDAAPGYYSGPDGGEVYQWAKNHYQWKRADGSVFTEWPTGIFKLDFPTGTGFVFAPPPASCNGCLPTLVWNYPDNTKITKYWISHRKEYDSIYQKPLEFQNYLLVNESKFGKPKLELENLIFYGSDKWNEFLRVFGEEVKTKSLFTFLKNEFGFENRGKIPVLLFDDYQTAKEYIGFDLPGANQTEMGFGGKDAIVLCCGEQMPERSGNPNFDADSLRRVNFSMILQKLTRNAEQVSCLKTIAETGTQPSQEILDPWFEEGLASYIESRMSDRKRVWVYTETEKLIRENKAPKSFKTLLDAKYKDNIPYLFGAILVKHIHDVYGKDAITSYQKETCLGLESTLALQKVTGVSADSILKESVKRFETDKIQILKDSKSLSLSGYTVMNPQFPNEYFSFLEKGFTLKESAKEIKSYDELPSLYKIFVANVNDYTGKREGDFLGPKGTYFFLWKKGNYRWFGDGWEANVFPGNQIVFRGSNFTLVEWENGKKQYVAPNGDSVVFPNRESVQYSE
ncbi:peptidase MA family protein [Leptospira levettii]|uniref:peptidase MA family protein n=1 Tax=Leptospira levettii TaxID=2023178 RepID=UPI00223E893D|nr:peptidase MA family protein [Leptospira levettii]MCW7475353.1 peptidase MA family protein [Leptospira levettii]